MSTHRLHSIDVLRGIAIGMVFLFHFFGVTYGQDFVPWAGNWPDWHANDARSFRWLYFLRTGGSGVTLFFVLSGFCIHYAYLRRAGAGASQSTLEFFWHRFFRIYPPYLVALIVFIVTGPQILPLNAIAHLSFTHNLFSDDSIVFGINPSFWSLPVEFQLYLIYPVFLSLRRRIGVNLTLLATLAISTAFTYLIPQTSPLDLHRLPFGSWFTWAIGAFVAERWYFSGRSAFRGHRYTIALMVVPFVLSDFYLPVARYQWAIRSLLAAYILDGTLHWKPEAGSSRLLRGISNIGLVSYSLYLWHQPFLGDLAALIRSALGLQHTAATLFGVCMPITAGILFLWARLSYLWIELPAITLGRRSWPLISDRWKRPRRGAV